MTTTTDRSRTQPDAPAIAGMRVTQRRVLAAESIKMRGLRSARWLLVTSVLSIVAVGVVPALGVLLADIPPAGNEGGGTDPTGGALTGVSFTQLLVAALGILVATSEYATGLVRATLTAVPRRLPVLWAKAAVVAVATLVGTLAAAFVTFFTAQAVLAAADVTISLSTPGVLRAIVGSAFVLALMAVLGVALGFLLRSAIGALAALFGLLFVLPLVGMLLPQVEPYLPSTAASGVLETGPTGGVLSPLVSLGVLALYAAVALTAAAVTLARRDA